MTKWEYKILSFGDFRKDNLNKLGLEGWELVISYIYGVECLIFKRPLQEEKKQLNG